MSVSCISQKLNRTLAGGPNKFLYFSCNVDDDSVIIGAWFEEPSTPGEGGDDPGSGGAQGDSDSSSSPGDSQAKTPHRHNSELTTIVPEKGEPHGVSNDFFISLTCTELTTLI